MAKIKTIMVDGIPLEIKMPDDVQASVRRLINGAMTVRALNSSVPILYEQIVAQRANEQDESKNS